MVDQRRNRALDHVEHVGEGTRRPPRRISQIFITRHRERIPTTQQLHLHGLDRRVEAPSRVLATSEPLEIGRAIEIHRNDQVEAGEIVGVDLASEMSDVVAAQAPFMGCQGVREVADVIAAGRSGIERDVRCSSQTRDVRGHGVSRWRSAMVAHAGEQHTDRERHTPPIQSVGRKRRNRRLLLTTNRLDDAIAALATIGDSSHDIASGIAATL